MAIFPEDSLVPDVSFAGFTSEVSFLEDGTIATPPQLLQLLSLSGAAACAATSDRLLSSCKEVVRRSPNGLAEELARVLLLFPLLVEELDAVLCPAMDPSPASDSIALEL